MLLRTIGARVCVHVGQHTQQLQDKAWEGKLVICCADSEEVRVYSPELISLSRAGM